MRMRVAFTEKHNLPITYTLYCWFYCPEECVKYVKINPSTKRTTARFNNIITHVCT